LKQIEHEKARQRSLESTLKRKQALEQKEHSLTNRVNDLQQKLKLTEDIKERKSIYAEQLEKLKKSRSQCEKL
jgi:hypothetical protein